MGCTDLPFAEIWCVDFEFSAPTGERPSVVCLVARELKSGTEIRLWRDELLTRHAPPYAIDDRSLVVAYYASAEMGCHLALGWPMPTHVLDLYAEFRNLSNGLPTPCGDGLLGALAWFGLNAIDAADKESMRELAQAGGPWSAQEKRDLLDYCASDVEALGRLLPKMAPALDLPRALLRGRYTKAVAKIEHCGIPLDVELLGLLRDSWEDIKVRLIEEIDRDYGVYEGQTFKAANFANWLARNGVPWPRLDSGKLDLADDTFRAMAAAYPVVAPLRELRASLSQLRLSKIAAGRDGRNRCLLSMFGSRTGRNQPSNSKFIFGTSAWLRGLIKPPRGRQLPTSTTASRSSGSRPPSQVIP